MCRKRSANTAKSCQRVPHVSNIVEESNSFDRNYAAATYKTFVSGRRSTAQRSHVNSSLPGIKTLSICLKNPRLPRNRRSQRKHSSPRHPVVSYCVPNPQREICNIHFLNEEGSSKMSSKWKTCLKSTPPPKSSSNLSCVVNCRRSTACKTTPHAVNTNTTASARRAGRTAGSSRSVHAPSRSRWISRRSSAYAPVALHGGLFGTAKG